VVNHKDSVFALLIESNPIPQVDDLDVDEIGGARYLATLEQRSGEMTQPNTKRTDQQKKTIRPRLAAAVVVVLAGVALIAINQADEISVAGQPGTTIEAYIDAYNTGDLDEVMTYFTEGSVLTYHPTDSDFQATGLVEIRALHLQDLLYGNGYTISNVETSGNTVTWDSVWGDNRGCVEGHATVVEEGKMLTWTWGNQFDCP
jgi:hypothetical protein